VLSDTCTPAICGSYTPPAVLSIPVGIGLYVAVYALVGANADDLVLAPWWWLALVPVGALPVIAGVTSLPARVATRIPSAQALRYE